MEEKKKGLSKGVVALIVAAVVAACAFGGWQYHQNRINEMREAGLAELEASVDLGDYREAEQKEIEVILEDAEAAILSSGDQAEVDKFVENAVNEISKLKTDAQYTKEEEEEAARQAELERQRQEEEAAAAAAAAAQSSGGGSSGGCVGGGADAFY